MPFFNQSAALRALFAGRPGIPASAATGTDYSFANALPLRWRNAANTADIDGVKVDSSNHLVLGATGLVKAGDTGTASATAGAATLSKQSGVITSEALTTAAGAAYTLTLTNTKVSAGSVVMASFQNGTNTQGTMSLGKVTPADGSVVIIINNIHASQALNGTIKIAFFVVN